MSQTLYFDNSTTTRPSQKGVSLSLPYLSEQWGSPMAPHRKGQEVVPAMRQAYEALYPLFDAKEKDTVLFTSSGAEGVNHVFLSTYLDVTLSTGKNQFIVANTDEAPALMAADRLEKMGCVTKTALVNERGVVTADALADVITPRTALVSLSWGNGLTGVVQPVAEIAALCQERGIYLHLEGSHTLGRLFFERDDVGADFITLNGDHLHAPQGTGALYIKEGIDCSPFISGGLEQGGLRAGSFSVAGFVALSHAAKEALESREYVCTEVARLRTLFEEKMMAQYPDAKVLFQKERRLPHISVIAFPGIVNEALLFALNQKNLFASIGGGSFQQLSLNLQAAKVDPLLAQTAISFSFSRETTEEEVDRGVEVVVEMTKHFTQGSREWFDGA